VIAHVRPDHQHNRDILHLVIQIRSLVFLSSWFIDCVLRLVPACDTAQCSSMKDSGRDMTLEQEIFGDRMTRFDILPAIPNSGVISFSPRTKTASSLFIVLVDDYTESRQVRG
jgi:hypothetical protein